MLQIPPLPTWDSLHPLIIHFPVVLLLLSPLFILISLVLAPPKGKPYMIAALLVLILGTGSLFIAGSTGHAASELAERGGAVDKVLEMHEDLASKTQIVFAGLSVILLGCSWLLGFSIVKKTGSFLPYCQRHFLPCIPSESCFLSIQPMLADDSYMSLASTLSCRPRASNLCPRTKPNHQSKRQTIVVSCRSLDRACSGCTLTRPCAGREGVKNDPHRSPFKDR